MACQIIYKMSNANIKAVLSYGKVFTGKERIFLNFIFYFLGGVHILSVSIIILLLIIERQSIEDMLYGLITLYLFSMIVFMVSLVLFVRNNKVIKKINLYLTDAVFVSAKITRCDMEELSFKPYQVKVYFKFNDIKKIMVSNPGNPITGYNKIFSKYDGKVIDVLYSNSYNQILFVK